MQMSEIPTEEDYLLWRNHPVSRLYRRFLLDYRKALQREAWARLQQGKPDDWFFGELSGRAKAVVEMEDLPYESIVAFYEREETDAP